MVDFCSTNSGGKIFIGMLCSILRDARKINPDAEAGALN